MSVKILVLVVHMYENGIFQVLAMFWLFVWAYIISEETAHYFSLKFCITLEIDKVDKMTHLSCFKKCLNQEGIKCQK